MSKFSPTTGNDDASSRSGQRTPPRGPVRLLAHRIGLVQVVRGVSGLWHLGGGPPGPVDLGVPRTAEREHADLAQPAPVRPGWDLEQPGALAAGESELVG